MNTNLSFLPSLFLLIGCQQDKGIDYRMSWELYVPAVDHDRPPQLGEMTWAMIEGTPLLESKISKIGTKWSRALECGITMTQVDQNLKEPDVIFTCEQLHGQTSSIENNRLHFDYDTSNTLNIIINAADCENPDNMLVRHAIGHALGFIDEFKWHQTVMGTLDLVLEGPDTGFFPMEIDGFRAWAHEQGAPGCGDKELPWSWEAYPNMYSSHPDKSIF
jgi:hypothetical protein